LADEPARPGRGEVDVGGAKAEPPRRPIGRDRDRGVGRVVTLSRAPVRKPGEARLAAARHVANAGEAALVRVLDDDPAVRLAGDREVLDEVVEARVRILEDGDRPGSVLVHGHGPVTGLDVYVGGPVSLEVGVALRRVVAAPGA